MCDRQSLIYSHFRSNLLMFASAALFRKMD